MRFDWAEYLELARDLTFNESQAGREAYLRSAISRAFYSAYHCAKEIHLRRGWSPPFGGDTHKETFRAIENSGKDGAVECADTLRSMKTSRVHADYETHFPGDLEKAALFMIEQAASIIEFPEQQ
jgi:uncharacterized protein (UPF0332 family)